MTLKVGDKVRLNPDKMWGLAENIKRAKQEAVGQITKIERKGGFTAVSAEFSDGDDPIRGAYPDSFIKVEEETPVKDRDVKNETLAYLYGKRGNAVVRRDEAKQDAEKASQKQLGYEKQIADYDGLIRKIEESPKDPTLRVGDKATVRKSSSSFNGITRTVAEIMYNGKVRFLESSAWYLPEFVEKVHE